MCNKVDPEQPLLVGWLQSCKCLLWLCLFCTCLGPSVTQELSRAILKKFQSIIFLILELRLLQSKCLNEYLISVIWGKVGKYYIIYWIKYFTSCGVLEILNYCADKKKELLFFLNCHTNNLYHITPAMNFNIISHLTTARSFNTFFWLKMFLRQNVCTKSWISCYSYSSFTKQQLTTYFLEFFLDENSFCKSSLHSLYNTIVQVTKDTVL